MCLRCDPRTSQVLACFKEEVALEKKELIKPKRKYTPRKKKEVPWYEENNWRKQPRLLKAQKEALYADFEEIPVSFERFVTDRHYLGNSWLDDNNNLTMWPVWQNIGQDLFPIPFRSPYSTLLLQGSTGAGKTSFAVNAVAAYYLHIILCLRNPHEYFDLAAQKNLVFAFLNIVTKTIAYKNAWGMLHKALIASPWFMERGYKTEGRRPEWVCTTKPIELLYGNEASQIVGLDIFLCFMDEISFARIRNVKAALERAEEVFNAAIERMESRFTKFGGIFEGFMIMASSKRTDMAAMEVFERKLMTGVYGKKVYRVDKPRWEMLPKGTYSGVTFPVAVGDKFKPSQVITENEVEEFTKAGYRIIRPPIETYDRFDKSLQTALTNIAGISVEFSATFLSGDRVMEAVDDTLKNPFIQDVIYVGTKDEIQYWQYFDLNRVPEEDFKKPLFIHLDASLGGDGNTLVGANVSYAKMSSNAETGELTPELHYKQIFKIKVRAPKGDHTMLSKNTQFIFWLRQQGFNIKEVTYDQFQCLHGNTKVLCEGELVSIKNIVPGAAIITYNLKTKKYEKSKVKNIWNTRKEKAYVRLVTHLNAAEMTLDHPVLTAQGYKKAEDLHKYDLIIGDLDAGRKI